MKKQNNTGFTLVELIVVIGIVGIVATLAVPSYQQLLERNRIKEAAESLRADMQFARTQAIKLSKDIIVTRNTGNNGAWCYGFNLADEDGDDVDVPCDCTQNDNTQEDFCDFKRILGTQFNQTNLLSQSGNTTFTFRRGTANAGNTCFSTSRYRLRVVVGNLGRATICTNTGTQAVIGYDSCPVAQQCL